MSIDQPLATRPTHPGCTWTLSQAAARVGGRLAGADQGFAGVTTDGRRDCAGRLYIALRGERFDGHDYVDQARASGALAALVDHPVDVDLPQWVVDDTRLALGRLAAAWRDTLPGRLVAVTGSNGKTTCKEMIAAVLGQAGSVLATRGNLNNDIGVPLTLLGASDQAFLVIEMGANHAGEIAYLTRIARPEVAVLTSVGRAHLEGFGSLEGVARAKGEIVEGLPADGTFIVPAGSPWTELWRGIKGPRRMLTCGPASDCAVLIPEDGITTTWDDAGFDTRFTLWIDGQALELRLALAGRHNVHNAAMAAAVGHTLGLDPAAIRAGLSGLAPVPGRLNPRRGAKGLRILDDTYNANPDSVLAALGVLAGLSGGLSGRRWLALGDLAELGPDADALHAELGTAARAAGIQGLYAVGPGSSHACAAFGPAARHFDDQPSLIAALREVVSADDLVLVKGSRRSAMERVVEGLL